MFPSAYGPYVPKRSRGFVVARTPLPTITPAQSEHGVAEHEWA
jgi:hypothetical protein